MGRAGAVYPSTRRAYLSHQFRFCRKIGALATTASLFGTSTALSNHSQSYEIPVSLCSPFGAYPNPLELDEKDRDLFHPVIRFPMIWQEAIDGSKTQIPNVIVNDLSGPSNPNQPTELATEEERAERQNELKNMNWFQRLLDKHNTKKHVNTYDIGRYDENRNIYTSEMFQDTENKVDGYSGARTVHVGIDLGGPVDTKVYAFSDGIIHSAGYNAELGDYGHVVVIEHQLPSNKKVWALYGHLNAKSTKGKVPGQQVRRGQVIGGLGDVHESGGWKSPHVHFQLSIEPPETHDMPGAVALEDRPKALVHYPDPRWVLGPLY